MHTSCRSVCSSPSSGRHAGSAPIHRVCTGVLHHRLARDVCTGMCHHRLARDVCTGMWHQPLARDACAGMWHQPLAREVCSGMRHSCQPTVKLHTLPLVWDFLFERGSTGAQGAAAGICLAQVAIEMYVQVQVLIPKYNERGQALCQRVFSIFRD